MGIQDLTTVVSPPGKPVNPSSQESWDQLQAELNVQLPLELLDMSKTYGSGTFCGTFLKVFNPSSPRYHEELNRTLESLQAAKQRGMEVGVFPDKPGLFPWGTDENGNTYCWLMRGEPSRWKVVIRKHGDDLPIRFSMTMIDFLTKSFLNKIKVKHWQNEPFTADELVFSQAKE
jgi:hypothetical protein